MLHHLIYVSDLSDQYPCDFQLIVNNAVKTNSAYDVTGALWCDGKHFIQLLEGDRTALSLIFHDKVKPAHQHCNINLLRFDTWERRVFPDWSMSYIGWGSRTKFIAERFVGRQNFNPQEISADDLIELLIYLQKVKQKYADAAIG